jgi:molecular chaperone DnaK
VPQVEVKFEIDADGIVHVSARDKATGKEQSIRIEASSGLSKEEVDDLVAEATKHEAEDKTKREAVENRNKLDSMVYQTEKLMTDSADKIPDELKEELEAAIKKGREAVESEDTDAVDAAASELEAAGHKLAAAMYADASDPGAAPGAGETGYEQAAASGMGDDGVIDAEFEESN